MVTHEQSPPRAPPRSELRLAPVRCRHYPNRVRQKKDLAVELGLCDRTVSELMKAGGLPEPCWLSSIPVWTLYRRSACDWPPGPT